MPLSIYFNDFQPLIFRYFIIRPNGHLLSSLMKKVSKEIKISEEKAKFCYIPLKISNSAKPHTVKFSLRSIP